MVCRPLLVSCDGFADFLAIGLDPVTNSNRGGDDQPVVDIGRKVSLTEARVNMVVEFVESSSLVMEALKIRVGSGSRGMHLFGDHLPGFVQMFPGGCDSDPEPTASLVVVGLLTVCLVESIPAVSHKSIERKVRWVLSLQALGAEQVLVIALVRQLLGKNSLPQ